MNAQSTNQPTRIHRTLGTNLLFIALAVALTVALSAGLHWRANAAVSSVTKEPLPVAVTRFELHDSYQRQVSFLGVIEAGRKADLGFEAPGKLERVMVREGHVVAQGEVIAELDSVRLQAQRRGTVADLARVESELELARLKAKRQRDLVATGAVSREASDETRLRAQALEAQVAAVSAALDDLDVALAKTRLTAPYAGTVAARYLDDGAVVTSGTPIVRLVETARLEAHIGVPVERATSLREGATYALRLRGEPLDAQLASLRPDIDPMTRTRTAVFELPEGLNALDGESLTLVLDQRVDIRGGWLPIEALLEGQRGAWTVLRLDSASSGAYLAVREAVEILDTRGDMAFVRGTLQDGAAVISQGVHRVTPGLPVQPVGD
ncbi:MAG: efflux RND transporter periplasmic adaptor subunit [Pseudomonadota bacterium]